MNVRDLKLAIACGIETEELKSLNKFFDELFSSLTVYTDGIKPDLIFMKGDICFMKQNLKDGYLLCRYKDFWKVLEYQYHCTYEETQEIIKYKVEEAESLTPKADIGWYYMRVEEAFKMGLLTPKALYNKVEEDLKNGLLTPIKKHRINSRKMEH